MPLPFSPRSTSSWKIESQHQSTKRRWVLFYQHQSQLMWSIIWISTQILSQNHQSDVLKIIKVALFKDISGLRPDHRWSRLTFLQIQKEIEALHKFLREYLPLTFGQVVPPMQQWIKESIKTFEKTVIGLFNYPSLALQVEYFPILFSHFLIFHIFSIFTIKRSILIIW